MTTGDPVTAPPTNPTDPPATTPPTTDPPAPPKTYTQTDFDRIIGQRVAEERAKYADYDELKTKASRLDELEAANLSELEKERKRAEEAEARAADVEKAAANRLRAAAILTAAATAGAADPNDVVTMLEANTTVTVADGKVVGAEEAVAALLEKYPALKANGTPSPNGRGDGGNRGGSAASDLESMSMAEFMEHDRKARGLAT